ncbi:MAG: hypothetical protein PHI45_03125 [Candidatus Pacebacteria bacterium]|nr:hypothetical protein [Candidatus Paceibacterota bacterium]MDD5013175.1 hypothetical protein [Candidatus Paceibacterota bacterium]MDD5753045.1 hypothetical protein [Candidatus Paceibacterota bacterium]
MCFFDDEYYDDREQYKRWYGSLDDPIQDLVLNDIQTFEEGMEKILNSATLKNDANKRIKAWVWLIRFSQRGELYRGKKIYPYLEGFHVFVNLNVEKDDAVFMAVEKILEHEDWIQFDPRI